MLSIDYVSKIINFNLTSEYGYICHDKEQILCVHEEAEKSINETVDNIVGPEILGNHNINTGTSLLFKTIVN